MNKLLKKMMVALLSFGLAQAVWADNMPNFQKTLQAAKQGNVDAQYNLGVMYAIGQGVPQDDAQAVQWYRQAAEQGDAQAQVLLGIAYESGRGVRQDSALAQEWYGKACDNGYQDGCDNYRRLKLGY